MDDEAEGEGMTPEARLRKAGRMISDYEFLKDVEAAAEFLAVLNLDERMRGVAERLRCDVFDELKPFAEKEDAKKRRQVVRLKAYREAR